MRRSEREVRVMRILEDEGTWSRDPGSCSGAIIDWNDRFPGLKFVQDGRAETGWTRDGRGTSLYDGVRLNPSTMLHDWISVKTSSIGNDGKLPAKLGISTGTREHIQSIMDGVNGGSSLPTVVFAEDKDGVGFALALDIAKFLRGQTLEIPPDGGWGRGQAPIAWIDPVERKCGDGGKGIKTYLCMVVSLYACGVRKHHWQECDAESLPTFVDRSFDWETLAKV